MSKKESNGKLRQIFSASRSEFLVRIPLFLCAFLAFFSVLLIFLFILKESIPAISCLGLRNLFFSTTWRPNVSNPRAGSYGMLAFLSGTLMTTFFAMIIGAPLGIGTAIFIDQVAPPKIREITRRGIELLAGIPSVIIGWFGLTLLVPFLAHITGSSGYGIAPASLVLAIMVLPTITTLGTEGLKAVPAELKEASVAMGATRWQTIYKIIIPAAKESLIVSTILGMGRAIGETMAVQMVIGNARQLAFSPLERTSTLTSRIVTDMGEATSVFRSALYAQALALLILAMCLILLVRFVTRSREVTT
ncbi:MAG: phosphate ABC transporter permease subunit PstC [Actinomycetota bacterium]|nr:phosphate ABC transporter permease subunit PstC [Actinomycetota bacterium]